MLLGLAVKELVIGGLSVLGVGMGTCNTVSIHKTKKRVSSCENAINEIASMKESIQRTEGMLTTLFPNNQQPTQQDKNIKVETVEVEKVEVVDNASTSTK